MAELKGQKRRVLDYMRTFGSISSMEAFNDLGVTRLSAVVFDLKDLGYIIETTREHTVNRYGEKRTFARYHLKGVAA